MSRKKNIASNTALRAADAAVSSVRGGGFFSSLRAHQYAWVLAAAMLLVAVLTFAGTALTTLTPDCMLSKMALDEVTYQQAHTSQRVITNLFDVLENTYYLYFDWTGRYTTTIFLYLFGILPELFFAAANAFFLVLAAWMLAATAKACRPCRLGGALDSSATNSGAASAFGIAPQRTDASDDTACPANAPPTKLRALLGGVTLADSAVFAVCAMLLWMIPDPGQIILWKTGAIVYLHSLAYSLPFLALHIMAFCASGTPPKRGIAYGAALFAYGMVVGATVEHLSLTLLLGCGLLLAVRVITGKTRLRGAIVSWECASLAGAAIGSVIMLVAPGNIARQADVYFNPIPKLSVLNTVDLSAHFTAIYDTGYFFVLLVLLGALLFASSLTGKKSVPYLAWSAFFVLLANVSLLALYFSPYLADRTYSVAYYFYLMAIAVPAWYLLEQVRLPAVHWGALFAALCVTALAFITPFRQVAGYRNVVRANDAVIAQAKANGHNVMVVPLRDEDYLFNEYARYLHPSFEMAANRSYATLHDIDLIVSGTDTGTFRMDAATHENRLSSPVTFAPHIVLNGVRTQQNAESLFVLLTFNEDLDTQLLYQNRKQNNRLVLTAELDTPDGIQTVQQIVYPGYRVENGSNVLYTNLVLPGKVTVNSLTVELTDPTTQQPFAQTARVLLG